MEHVTNEVIADPVSHISISGFHGVEEVTRHVESAHTQAELDGSRRGRSLATLLVGAVIGAAVMYMIDRQRGPRGDAWIA